MERKKDLVECDSDTMQDGIKIRLHMWQVNYKYERDNTNTKCPLFGGSEDTKEFVLENYAASGFFQVFRNK